MTWVPPGFGPFENWEPEHTVKGGEHLTLAGLEIEVVFTPGHSPGHVTYAIAPAAAPADALPTEASAPEGPAAEPAGEAPVLLSGDVLFQGTSGGWTSPGASGACWSARSPR